MAHVVTLDDGSLIDVDRLIVLARDKEARLVWRTLKELEGHKVNRSPESGFSEERYQGTDTKWPLLVDPEGRVLDGRHRLARWVDEGAERAPVIVMRWDEIEACKVQSS
jgi:hypothetical protein